MKLLMDLLAGISEYEQLLGALDAGASPAAVARTAFLHTVLLMNMAAAARTAHPARYLTRKNRSPGRVPPPGSP